MDTPSFRRLIDTITRFLNGDAAPGNSSDAESAPELEELFLQEQGRPARVLSEALLRSASGNQIRVDRPKHGGGGQVHGHILGRKGNQIGVVNLDGTGSHGTKMRLNRHDAETLRDAGFSIRNDRIVEWIVDPGLTRELLLE